MRSENNKSMFLPSYLVPIKLNFRVRLWNR